MERGGWRSVSMVTRYQHATSERDAHIVGKLPPLFSQNDADTTLPPRLTTNSTAPGPPASSDR
jgi:hypothetical protein